MSPLSMLPVCYHCTTRASGFDTKTLFEDFVCEKWGMGIVGIHLHKHPFHCTSGGLSLPTCGFWPVEMSATVSWLCTPLRLFTWYTCIVLAECLITGWRLSTLSTIVWLLCGLSFQVLASGCLQMIFDINDTNLFQSAFSTL